MKEGHERIRHSLKNKDGTCVSYKDLILKYGVEHHYVYCSRINYNGLRVEHCIQNALEPRMEMASIKAFQKTQPKGTRLFHNATSSKTQPVVRKSCVCKVFVLKLNITKAILSGE